MDTYDSDDTPSYRAARDQPTIYLAQVVPERPAEVSVWSLNFFLRAVLPAVLFPLTCVSTCLAYAAESRSIEQGLVYASCLMTILLCHEAGHFIQTRRYRVRASFPYFIPMPIPPIGTMGAVILMESRAGDRKTLFDIGITGPLAGLIPTLVCCVFGLLLSVAADKAPRGFVDSRSFGKPLIFHFLEPLLAPGAGAATLHYHAMAYAGWIGLLITSLNLFPIGQLDGGHVLYGLLRTKAHGVAWALLLAAGAAVLVTATCFGRWEVLGWLLMIGLLLWMGPRHPPSTDDNVPLGAGRVLLGWLTLALVPICFTPIPFNG